MIESELDTFFTSGLDTGQRTFDFCCLFFDPWNAQFSECATQLVPGVLDEWLAMSQADQTALVMAKLDEEFFTEWLLWVSIKRMENG